VVICKIELKSILTTLLMNVYAYEPFIFDVEHKKHIKVGR